MTLRPILLALTLALSPAALAAETPPSASPAEPAPTLNADEQATMQSFAAAHPDCGEWSDGCVICKRAASLNCSTPGIACQPHEIACRAP